MTEAMHIGRSWIGHPLEDTCPCPKEKCGLVSDQKTVKECTEHPHRRTKTIRQMHYASECSKVKT